MVLTRIIKSIFTAEFITHNREKSLWHVTGSRWLAIVSNDKKNRDREIPGHETARCQRNDTNVCQF